MFLEESNIEEDIVAIEERENEALFESEDDDQNVAVACADFASSPSTPSNVPPCLPSTASQMSMEKQ